MASDPNPNDPCYLSLALSFLIHVIVILPLHVVSLLGARLAATRTTRLIQRKAPFSGTTVSDLVPETHQRSFGQPTVYSHPYLMKKGEGMDTTMAFC